MNSNTIIIIILNYNYVLYSILKNDGSGVDNPDSSVTSELQQELARVEKTRKEIEKNCM